MGVYKPDIASKVYVAKNSGKIKSHFYKLDFNPANADTTAEEIISIFDKLCLEYAIGIEVTIQSRSVVALITAYERIPKQAITLLDCKANFCKDWLNYCELIECRTALRRLIRIDFASFKRLDLDSPELFINKTALISTSRWENLDTDDIDWQDVEDILESIQCILESNTTDEPLMLDEKTLNLLSDEDK